MNTPQWAIDAARRLAADVERGLGAQVEIILTPPDEARRCAASDGDSPLPVAWIGIHVTIGGEVVAGGGLDIQDLGADSAFVAYQLALLVQEDLLVASGRVWPAHPERPSVPLCPGEDGWTDPDSGDVVLRYGEVEQSSERPHSPDGTVLWWLDPIDFGVIASEEGDIAFDYFTLEPLPDDSRQVPSRGQRVQYAVGNRRRGAFRIAEKVLTTPP